MSVISVDLISEDLTESLKRGFLQYDLVRIYQVITDARSDGPVTVLSSSSLPAIGSALVIGSTVAACISRVPKRTGDPATAKKWKVTCKFTNSTDAFDRDANGNPTTDPEQIVKEVKIEYEKITQPLTSAELVSFTHGPAHDVTTTLANPTWISTDATAPVNSALDAIYLESTRTIKRISVSKYFRDWPNTFDEWEDSINDDTLTITQSDANGTRATYTFDAETVQLETIDKEDIWKDGKLYFKATFNLVHDPQGFVHSVVDAGQRQRIAVGSKKSDGTTYTQADLDAFDPPVKAGSYALRAIEQDGYAGGDPVPLNGQGQPLSYDPVTGTVDKDDVVYVNWRDTRHVLRDFDLLGL